MLVVAFIIQDLLSSLLMCCFCFLRPLSRLIVVLWFGACNLLSVMVKLTTVGADKA